MFGSHLISEGMFYSIGQHQLEVSLRVRPTAYFPRDKHRQWTGQGEDARRLHGRHNRIHL